MTELSRIQDVEIGTECLRGILQVPDRAHGIVLFAHGSCSSRRSPRNHRVAEGLHKEGLATVLLDLLTPIEEQDYGNVFDIRLMADRLTAATEWVHGASELGDLPIGYFGAGTGAAAALLAAAEPGAAVSAIVCRGGRPDLALDALPRVHAPTLFLVGSKDEAIIALNHAAVARMTAVAELAIVPGAGHLFEERGALDEVMRRTKVWFQKYLRGEPRA